MLKISCVVLAIASGIHLESEELSVNDHQELAFDSEQEAADSEVKPPLSRLALREKARRDNVALDDEKPAVQEEEAKKPEVRKKLKAHFVGSKRPPQNVPGYVPEPKAKKSTRIKNKWVSTKTHPKITEPVKQSASSTETKTSFGEGKALAAPRRQPRRFSSHELLAEAGPDDQIPAQKKKAEEKGSDEGREYPHMGFNAPNGAVFVTAEWLFWRTRQGGMEFAVQQSSASPQLLTDAVTKKLTMDWQSGFRVGLGVHLPHNGWDIYTNYTDFRPEDSDSVSGSLYPLLLYQGAGAFGNVSQAQAHWELSFQTLDLEIGRAYYIGESLVLRPSMGMRGAWINQNAHFHYQGGSIPVGSQGTVRNKNHFKGAGVRAGINSNWELGVGLSFNADLFASLVVGHFYLLQRQQQPNGTEPIDLGANLRQLSPNAQLFLGLSWDRNFYHDRCHAGITFGFESQYWWRQNQIARFSDSTFPIYVRASEDLAFYGINLRSRFDF